ncbi:MAG TPA: hypothetical protein VMW21_01760 [Patescibacteria group bacterium]|nr:hypothetical protein [Patescibacteria group bacterium]
MANFKRKLNKKIIFIFILILAVGGFFWWWQGREIKGSPEDYVIKETTEGIFVENKKASLLVKAPEGWEAEKIKLREGWVMFYSPETEIKWKQEGVVLLPLGKGCIIDVEVMYKKMDLIQIESDIRYSLSSLVLEFIEFDNISINNREALKTIFNTQKVGPGIIANIPWDDKVFIFNLIFGVNEKENCIQEFDRFLETISIK